MATHSSILAWRIPGHRSLVGYSPKGYKESDMTEGIADTHTHTHTHTYEHIYQGLKNMVIQKPMLLNIYIIQYTHKFNTMEI